MYDFCYHCKGSDKKSCDNSTVCMNWNRVHFLSPFWENEQKYWLLYNDWCERKMSKKMGISVWQTYSSTHSEVRSTSSWVNSSWMLDLCLWGQNKPLIPLTMQSCSRLCQWHTISLIMTSSTGIGLRWFRIGVNEIFTDHCDSNHITD